MLSAETQCQCSFFEKKPLGCKECLSNEKHSRLAAWFDGKEGFSYVWKDQKEAVLLACKMLEECSRQEKDSENAVADSILKRMGMLEKKLEGLREMRALGDITREAFLIDTQKVEEECKN